jgi:hypothetical protein
MSGPCGAFRRVERKPIVTRETTDASQAHRISERAKQRSCRGKLAVVKSENGMTSRGLCMRRAATPLTQKKFSGRGRRRRLREESPTPAGMWA